MFKSWLCHLPVSRLPKSLSLSSSFVIWSNNLQTSEALYRLNKKQSSLGTPQRLGKGLLWLVTQLDTILSLSSGATPQSVPTKGNREVSCLATVMTPQACIHILLHSELCLVKWHCSEVTQPCPLTWASVSLSVRGTWSEPYLTSFPAQLLAPSPSVLQARKALESWGFIRAGSERQGRGNKTFWDGAASGPRPLQGELE